MALTETTAQPSGAPGDPGAAPPGDQGAEEQLAWLTAKSGQSGETPYHYLLLLRFVLINMLGFALLAAAQIQGLLEMVLAADRTYLSALIFSCFWAAWASARSRSGRPARTLTRCAPSTRSTPRARPSTWRDCAGAAATAAPSWPRRCASS